MAAGAETSTDTVRYCYARQAPTCISRGTSLNGRFLLGVIAHAVEVTIMSRKQRRLFLIGSGMTVLAIAVALMLNALRDSIVFFNSPSDVVEKHVPPGTRVRLGGLVKNGSVVRGNNLSVR